MKTKFKELHNIGKLMILIGGLLAVPVVMVPFYPDDTVYLGAFLVPSFVSIALGLIVGILFRHKNDEIQFQYNSQDGSLTVLFAWFYGFLLGAFPFVLSGQLTFLQGLYESVSGWTTTGLSVMDVTQTSPTFLFYRSFMQFCGGLGFIMMMIMIIQGKDSMSLYNAEGHPDRLMPNIKKTAQVIFQIYSLFLVIGTLIYIVLGMPFFDSLLHTMSALSTGGFSTRADSIGAFDSPAIEAFTIVLMIIGTTNFAVLMLLTKRKFDRIFKVSELRFLGILLLIFVPIISISLFQGMYLSLGDSIRHSLFNIVSALSTTGYSTMGYENWPAGSIGIMIVMMIIGGGLGSTAGGLKLTRVYLMIRILGFNIYKRLSSQRKVSLSYYGTAQGKRSIDTDLISDTIGFIALYLMILTTGGLLITWTSGASLTESMFEFASSLGTVGLSIGLTGPTTDGGTLIVQMIGMILGRLEIFIVLIGIYSGAASVRYKLREATQ
ncbi:Potassium uptake protein TrkH [Alkalibacterium sp. AK22]|uniref:TrkH family potassium uptake protein n=1 Tax=Alkalibacterium sp. AK22 TaxID=1229520 RepID=UPI00044FCFFD|nr:potassium transporter TrkG [Alkalibacterium sp. AK22]EXJ22660.1 Potassium uptake protein TrkH [Alkalibacterium sp. AK22]